MFVTYRSNSFSGLFVISKLHSCFVAGTYLTAVIFSVPAGIALEFTRLILYGTV